MPTVFIDSGDALSDRRPSVDIPKARYSHFFLRIEGTNDTGQTATLADLGRIRVVRDGEQLQGASIEFYAEQTDLHNGTPENSSTTAAAFTFGALVPAGLWNVPNAWDIRGRNEVDVKIDWEDLSAIAAACTWELYGIETTTIPERYNLRIEEQDIQASGAGRIDEVLTGPNLGTLYLKDGSSVVDGVTLSVDGDVAIDNLNDATLLAITNLFSRVETAQNLIEHNIVRTGRIEESFNDSTKLSVSFTGAGTLEVTKFRVMPSPRAESSQAAVAQNLRDRVAMNVPKPKTVRRGAFTNG